MRITYKLILALFGIQSLTNCQTTSFRCTDSIYKHCESSLSNEEAPENLYLEEVYGKDAIKWVEDRNKTRSSTFENDPRFQNLKDSTLKIMNDPKKLISVSFHNDWAYNFWQDAKNVRGLWRRMPIADYLKGQRQWQILIDFDELAKLENKNWVYGGATRYKNRALIRLSLGGKDAKVTREFDLDTQTFVEDGFSLPEGKNEIRWINENEVFLGLALDDDQVTDSGYPKDVRIWKRGTRFQSSKVIYRADKKDISSSAYVSRDEEDGPVRYKYLSRSIDFFNNEYFIVRDDNTLAKLDVPTDADLEIDEGQTYLTLKSAWEFNGTKYKPGSLLKIDIEKLLSRTATAEIVFEPSKTQFLQSQFIHKGRVFLVLSKDVTSLVVEAVRQGSKWVLKKYNLPDNSTIEIDSYSEKHGFITFSSEGFIQPETIFKIDMSSNKTEQVDQAPGYFDPKIYTVKQYFTKSKDRTQIPYFVVHKKSMRLDGKNPTILNAYGGFENSKTPYYLATIETSWLREGGVWVVANIRGGGEYGPEWHTSAIKENRQRVFDDFFAVSEDLIRRKITSARHLGAAGSSNGGLLMGVAMIQRPELYNAIAIKVPLLDMLRYDKLLAGASWVGEYGSPDDPKMRAVLAAYSPYQNIKPDVKYPEVFFMTSTADDRVHPGHARRSAAKMEFYGHPFFYYENTEGGHGGAANNIQRAKWSALEFTYFLQKLKE